MKKILCLLLLLTACAKQPEPVNNTPTPSQEANVVVIPESISTKMPESKITTSMIDDYLFLPNAFYIDCRDATQFLNEGSIAGFINIPFYQMIASTNEEDNTLYTMTKIKEPNNIQLGDVNSFVANYKESDDVIYSLIPQDTTVFVISTAGVESTYFLNLLLQLGYDIKNLHNVGGFSNSVASNKAYKDLKDKKHMVYPLETYNLKIDYSWKELTKNK